MAKRKRKIDDKVNKRIQDYKSTIATSKRPNSYTMPGSRNPKRAGGK